MCGIFGFLSIDGRGPDLACLRRIAAETETRGRHAFGLAWINAGGTIRTFKRPGAATACLGDLDACHDAVAAIGHCRWATHGDPQDNRNNHPHPAGRGFVVHNGVVRNYAELVRRYRLRPRSDCDSEVLGLLMMRRAGTLAERAAWAVAQTEGPLALFGLWNKPLRLLVVRRGNPLCFSETPGGFYVASLPAGLPGKATTITAGRAGVLWFDRGKLGYTAYSIARSSAFTARLGLPSQGVLDFGGSPCPAARFRTASAARCVALDRLIAQCYH